MDTSDRWLEGEGRSELRILVDAAQAWIDQRAFRLSAAIAYYALIAMIPVLMLVVGFASIFFDDSRVINEVEQTLADFLGKDTAAVVVESLGAMRVDNANGLLSLVGLGALLFSATILFVAWKDLVDIMWNTPWEGGARGTIRRRFFGVLAVVGCGVLLSLNLMMGTAVAVLERLFDSNLAGILLTTVGTLVPMVLGVSFIAVLYKYTPEIDLDWGSVWLASAVAMGMLAVGAWLYGIYLANFGFRSASGVAGTAFFGLALVYYAAMILLYGMEIVKQKYKGAGSREGSID